MSIPSKTFPFIRIKVLPSTNQLSISNRFQSLATKFLLNLFHNSNEEIILIIFRTTDYTPLYTNCTKIEFQNSGTIISNRIIKTLESNKENNDRFVRFVSIHPLFSLPLSLSFSRFDLKFQTRGIPFDRNTVAGNSYLAIQITSGWRTRGRTLVRRFFFHVAPRNYGVCPREKPSSLLSPMYRFA